MVIEYTLGRDKYDYRSRPLPRSTRPIGNKRTARFRTRIRAGQPYPLFFRRILLLPPIASDANSRWYAHRRGRRPPATAGKSGT